MSDSATLWTIACQAPLSVGTPRQKYWSACHFLLQEIFLTQGSNPPLLHWEADSLPLSHQGSPTLYTTLEYPMSILLRNTYKLPTSTQHPLGVGVLQSLAHTAHGGDGWMDGDSREPVLPEWLQFHRPVTSPSPLRPCTHWWPVCSASARSSCSSTGGTFSSTTAYPTLKWVFVSSKNSLMKTYYESEAGVCSWEWLLRFAGEMILDYWNNEKSVNERFPFEIQSILEGDWG